MATGGEVPGRLPGSAGPEHLNRRICQPCLEKDNLIYAIGLCVDCQDYLCLKCLDDHSTQQHRVLDREHMKDGQTQSKPEDSCSESCPFHENETIQYYCASHCHLGCKLCIQCDHAKCEEVHYIPKVSKELVNNEDYTHAGIQLMSVLNKFMDVFRNSKRNSEEIDKSSTNALRELQDFKNRINKALKKIRREIVNAIQTIRLKAERELTIIRYKYKTAHIEPLSSLAKIEALRITNHNCSSFIEMMRTKMQIKSLENLKQEASVDSSYWQSSIKFTPNRDLLELLKNPGGFGTASSAGTRNVLSGFDEVPVVSDVGSSFSDDFTVLSQETVPSFYDDFSVITDTGSRISQPSLRTANVQTWLYTLPDLPDSDTGSISSGSAYGTREYLVKNLHVRTVREYSRCHITGMVVLPESRLVLTDYGNASIKTVDVRTGKVVSQMGLNSKPWDITFIENNRVVFTMPFEQKLVFVTVEDNNFNIDRTLTVGGGCWGVSYRNDTLAVSYRDSDKVEIINLLGDVLHSIANDKSEETPFNCPGYVTFGQDDTTLYVSNFGKNNVVCVKTDGTVSAIYADRDLRNPKKAVVESSGNVYVCAIDTNTVHKITDDCKKLQVLLTQADDLHRPHSICLSEEEDKLYVGKLASDYVRIYRTGRNESQQQQ